MLKEPAGHACVSIFMNSIPMNMLALGPSSPVAFEQCLRYVLDPKNSVEGQTVQGSADVSLVSLRFFGGELFVLLHFTEEPSVATSLEVKSAVDLAQLWSKTPVSGEQIHQSPTVRHEQEGVKVFCERSGPLENEQGLAKFNFALTTRDDGRDVEQITRILYHLGLNVVAHDGVAQFPTQRDIYSDAPHLYHHVFKCYLIDQTLYQFLGSTASFQHLKSQLVDRLGREGVRVVGEINFSPPQYGWTLDPRVKSFPTQRLKDYSFVHFNLAGKDTQGMISAATSFLNHQVLTHTRNPKRKCCVVRSCARSMGSLGIVKLSATIDRREPSEWSQLSDEILSYVKSHNSMYQHIVRGCHTRVVVNDDSPWHHGLLTSPLVGTGSSATNKPGQLRVLLSRLRLSRFFDPEGFRIVEFDGRVLPDGTVKYVAGIVFNPHASQTNCVEFISNTARDLGINWVWRMPGLPDDSGTWDLPARSK